MNKIILSITIKIKPMIGNKLLKNN